jgi:3-oxoacyl-[acyl-carrier-protein] synthase II
VKLTIKGIGWITPAGFGSGRPGEVFSPGPGQLPAMKSKMFLDEIHPRFGRFDSYTKAGFGAISLAMRSAGLFKWQQKRDIGLIVSTNSGCLEADLAYLQTAAFDGGSMASPNLFTYTVPNCMLGEASIQFGLTGPALVIDDCENHLAGILTGADLIRWGICDTVLAGWCNVQSKEMNFNSNDICGAIFFLLTKDNDSAPLICDENSLFYEKEQVTDITHLSRLFLKLKK